VMTFDQLFE